MSKNVLIILSPGVEEMEIVITADVLRRAGIEVTIAGLNGLDPVVCSRKLVLVPDTALEACKTQNYKAVVLPGGLGGMQAMADSALVGELLKKQEDAGELIAAICAAPVALATHGIALGKSLTSYPAFKDKLTALYKYVDNKTVVYDSNLLTSQGPATAFEFALKLVEILADREKAAEVAKGMLYKNI